MNDRNFYEGFDWRHEVTPAKDPTQANHAHDWDDSIGTHLDNPTLLYIPVPDYDFTSDINHWYPVENQAALSFMIDVNNPTDVRQSRGTSQASRPAQSIGSSVEARPTTRASVDLQQSYYKTGSDDNNLIPAASDTILGITTSSGSPSLSFPDGDTKSPNNGIIMDDVPIPIDNPDIKIGYVLRKGKVKCLRQECNSRTFGRQAELRRHYDTAHAEQKPKHWCLEPECERSEAVGGKPFPRTDKRDEHVRIMHRNRRTDTVVA